MTSVTAVFKALAALIICTGMAGAAHANMLLTDLTSINVRNFAGHMWSIRAQVTEELHLECTNCETQVLLNIRLGDREEFGELGSNAAKKAKFNCNRSLDMLLQCDTIEGIVLGNVSGLTATKRVLENFYIASLILGDDVTLIKMTTKAATKHEADTLSRELFEAMKAEMILQ